MKRKIPFILLAAAAACGFSFAEPVYTTPVGYTTQPLNPNQFNLIGFNVLNPQIAAGQLTAVSGADITDSDAAFTSALPAGKMGVVEIISGTAAGTVQEFNIWTDDTITLPATIDGINVGDSYVVRIAPTLQDTFTEGVITGSPLAGNADKVWVPNGSGGYDKYWLKTVLAPTGWHKTTTGSDNAGEVTEDIPLIYIDGVLVEKQGDSGSLVLTGEVKTSASSSAVITGFNLVSINPPVRVTLLTAGLEDPNLLGSPLAGNADKLWVPDGSGGFTKYWYKTVLQPTGWHVTTTGSDNAGEVTTDVDLPPAVFIERSGDAKIITIDVPDSYSGL